MSMFRLKGRLNAQQAIGVFRRLSSEAAASEVRLNPRLGPSFKDFLVEKGGNFQQDITSFDDITKSKLSRKFFVETYGCQMNLSDTEIVRSILLSSGHTEASDVDDAELIFVNTCAIRDNAEAKIWRRLQFFRSMRKKSKRKGYPKVGVLGCMAERLKDKLLEEEAVDIVCGPDAYRDLPRLLDSVVTSDQKEANTQLSFEETYADINPVRIAGTGSAFVSIMRGCNNMCSFCVVPFTRGRERSRDLASIVNEIERLVKEEGIKEVI
jgi:tRNA A37 methylthiotransferase MiaB